MCGLAGLITREPADLAPILTAMSHQLRHRGPDAAGELYWAPEVEGASGGARVGLAHRRLSIIDLTDGAAQPLTYEDGRYRIVYNGEIYNFIELRQRLARSGCSFATRSDTEVLVAALSRWGVEALPGLVGMFAFALLDTRERTVLLARDPFGIKPLYYTRWARGLAFASEIKALLELPGVERTAAPGAVYDYLSLGLSDHGSGTFFETIHQLPPSTWARIDLDRVDDRPEPRTYGSADGAVDVDIGFDEAATRLREILARSIELHCRADVPVATALSGGIDSTALAVGLRRAGGADAEIHAFGYAAEDEAVNEERWMERANLVVGAELHTVGASSDGLVDDLDALIAAQDEPFGSTTIYAQYRVFRAVREAGIKVVLDGQGADELLAGYHNYLPRRIVALLRQGRVDRAWRLLRRALELPGARGGRIARSVLFLVSPGVARRWLSRGAAPSWLRRAWFDDAGVRPVDWPRASSSLQETLREEVGRYRIPRLLRYADRNAMAHSVENRVPFLTPELAGFVGSLPDEYLLGDDGSTKRLLRAAMRGLVPDEILDRRDKIGFATPEGRWLASADTWVRRVLSSDAATTVIDQGAALDAWSRFASGRGDYDRSLWRAINLVRWADLRGVTFG